VNIELVQARIVAINQDIELFKTNFSKLEGHLAESNYWLGELLKKAAEEVKAKELQDGGQEVHPEGNQEAGSVA
jgi:hypothetical protein